MAPGKSTLKNAAALKQAFLNWETEAMSYGFMDAGSLHPMDGSS